VIEPVPASADSHTVTAGIPEERTRARHPQRSDRAFVPGQRTADAPEGSAAELGDVFEAITDLVDDGGPVDARILLDAAQRLTGLALWCWDLRTGQLTWSAEMFALLGLPPGRQPTIDQWQQMLHPDDRMDLGETDLASIRAGEGWHLVFRAVPPDGTLRYLQAWCEVVRDETGAATVVIGATMDVTEQEQTLQALRANREEFRLAFDEAPHGMAVLELTIPTASDPPVTAESIALRHPHPPRVQVVRINRALAFFLGLDSATLGDRTGVEFVHPEDRYRLWTALMRSLDPGSGVQADEVRVVRSDGTMRHVWVHAAAAGKRDEHAARVLLHVIDVTALRLTEAELQRLALTDSVTCLDNRMALEIKTQRALREVGPGRGLGMMLLDLDRFKTVNDSLGHVAGDALLVEVARRLRGAVPHSAMVARLGGDEFAVLIHPCPSPEALAAQADMVRLRLTRPYTLPGASSLNSTASFGVTWCDDGTHRMEDLYREADLALYEAKDKGRNAVALFDADLRSRADARIESERRLRTALAHDGVRIHLQPVVDLATGEVVGAEALARMEHPSLGLMMPADFIEIAEDTGLVVDVDCRVTELAVEALARPGGAPAPQIAVNVSPHTLDHPEYRSRLAKALRRHGVDASRLLVEVTETSLLDATGHRATEVRALQADGIKVGIDDFGTGYSALAYLDYFDLDFLKIDRSFVSRLGTGKRPDAVVSAIISLAHAHGMAVTAEGVETAEQADLLRAMCCDRAQGWHFGRPAAI
jgi:diguanylate cyclase (GGDEF)-like protein/PAS domain S-box-containing protein